MAYDNLQELPTPNTTPAGPGFVSQTITDNSPGMIHNLNSGGSISVKFKGNYWTIAIAYPQLTIAEGSTIVPFLFSLQGGFTNFYIQLPTHANPNSGAWSTVPSASSVGLGAVANQVVVTGWAAATSAAGSTLTTGDMIKFTNIKKVYMIVNTELSGDTMTLSLNTEIADLAALSTSTLQPNDIKFRVRIDGKAPSVSLNADGLYEGFSLSLRENTL